LRLVCGVLDHWERLGETLMWVEGF
jgi:hypothetical protein